MVRIKDILVTFGIIFLIINIIGLIIIGFIIKNSTQKMLDKMRGISNEVQIKLNNTNELLTKLNSNIQGLDQLNKRINDINNNISSIEKSISILPNNTASITNFNNSLIEIKNNLKNLTKIYPPNQTLVINNINQETLNKIINNAVDIEFSKISKKVNFNFILNIAFALLSLGGISFAIYFFSRKGKA